MKLFNLDKKVFISIAQRSLCLLIVPIVASFFVSGFNWGFFDFVFAFCMFTIFQFIYHILIRHFANKLSKDFIAFIVILVFAIIWGTLATG